jgi:hypothetical protein
MRERDGKIEIYDIHTDQFREITAQDVESWENQAVALAMLLTGLPQLRQQALLVAQGKAPPWSKPEKLYG